MSSEVFKDKRGTSNKRNRSPSLYGMYEKFDELNNNCLESRTKVKKIGSISPCVYSIGGIYNVQTADVWFTFGDVLVPAHKSILAANSPKFYRIFFTDSRSISQFSVTNITIQTFCQFLATFYVRSMDLKRSDVPQLFQLAMEFGAGKCTQMCHKFFMQSLEIGADDVLWTLELTMQYDCREIQQRCIDIIRRFGSALIESQQFLVCNRKVLKVILGENFVGRSEIKLLNACIKWARRKVPQKKFASGTRIRGQLSDCFEMIHFDWMTASEFVKCLSDYIWIFTADEIRNISKAINQTQPNGQHETKETQQIPRGQLLNVRHVFKQPLAIFRRMLGDANSADIHFTFNADAVRISAHKSILMVKSHTFRRLFQNNDRTEFPIAWAKLSFIAFLKLLYGYSVSETVTNHNFGDILELANQYQVKGIFRGQEAELKRLINVGNLFLVANLYEKYRFIDWMHFSVGWIEEHCQKYNLNDAFHEQSLVSCDRKLVQRLMQINYFNRNEVRVCQAIINWAKQRCFIENIDPNVMNNLRTILSGIFELIPFHKMNRNQFCTLQNQYPGLLTDSEIEDIKKLQEN